MKYLKAALPATEDYAVTRADLVNRLTDAFQSYVGASNRGGRAYINNAKQALQEDISGAFYRGYEDAAGADAETEDDDEAWLTGKGNEQQSFMDAAFAALKQDRADETITDDALVARAETWGTTLDGIYQEGKARGKGNLMLTFRRPDGVEASKQPCDECTKYDGQRHSAKYWSKRNAFQRNGNPDFGCGRWEGCTHDLFTDQGDLFSES